MKIKVFLTPENDTARCGVHTNDTYRNELLRSANHGMSGEKNGNITWLVENSNVPTADLMVGCGGVCHFLLRLNDAGRNTLSFPLLSRLA